MTVSGMPWPASTPRTAPPRARAAEAEPITTPTGLRVAGFGRRVVPFLLDRLLVLVPFVASGVLMEASRVADLAAAGRLGPAGEVAVLRCGRAAGLPCTISPPVPPSCTRCARLPLAECARPPLAE